MLTDNLNLTKKLWLQIVLTLGLKISMTFAGFFFMRCLYLDIRFQHSTACPTQVEGWRLELKRRVPDERD